MQSAILDRSELCRCGCLNSNGILLNKNKLEVAFILFYIYKIQDLNYGKERLEIVSMV